jgi:hypothetical protein
MLKRFFLNFFFQLADPIHYFDHHWLQVPDQPGFAGSDTGHPGWQT